MIIDCLTHILPPYFNTHRDDALARDRTFAELFSNPKTRIVQASNLVSEMNRSGIDRSVIAGFGWTNFELARRSNDYMLEAASRYPERLIPLCSINPLWDSDIASQEAERCLIAGAVGIGELHADTQGWANTEYDKLGDVMEVSRVFNAVLIVHSSEPIGHTYPGKGSMTPDKLLRMAMLFPENRFVFSHFGGGLPFYAHMSEVDDALKNVWFDSAASPFLYDPRVYETVTKALEPNRVIFASDYPLLSQKRALEHLRDANLSQSTTASILNGGGQLYGFIRLNRT